MFGNSNYRRSNRIQKVRFRVPREAKKIAKKILISRSSVRRQRLSTELIDLLSTAAKIQDCKVKISNTRQYHRKKGNRTVYKQYGFYRPVTCYIYITNRTAVRAQILAPKTFLDTLLHEWVHHYDTCRLKLNSIHTKGFYARLNDLKGKLGV